MTAETTEPIPVPDSYTTRRGWIIHTPITATADGQWHGRWSRGLRVPRWAWVTGGVFVAYTAIVSLLT